MKKWMAWGLTACLLLCGCGKKLPYDSAADVFLIGDVHVTLGMMNALFYAFEEQQNVQNEPLYGGQFWDMVCFENPEITYGEYEKEYIFYENLMNMFCLSELWSASHTLSEEEMRAVSECASSYISGLDSETQTLLGITQEDALALCTACYTAILMQEELGREADLVISEEEIRVITVSEAYFETEEEAQAFAAGIDEGQDADSLSASAKQYLQENLTRDDIEDEAYCEAVFALRERERTDVLQTADGYLVAVLTDAFQDELSEKRRQELLLERRKERIGQACADYQAQTDIYISQKLWQSYTLKMQELPKGVSNLYETFAALKTLAEG